MTTLTVSNMLLNTHNICCTYVYVRITKKLFAYYCCYVSGKRQAINFSVRFLRYTIYISNRTVCTISSLLNKRTHLEFPYIAENMVFVLEVVHKLR